jgi:DNA-binding protein H-NS
MAKINLEKMSRDELVQLRKDIDKAIKTFEDRQRKEAIAAAEAAARKKGFSLAQLTDGKVKKSRQVNPPKYRHPENPSLTWSGRGRQPAWYKELTEAGTSEEDLLIAG